MKQRRLDSQDFMYFIDDNPLFYVLECLDKGLKDKNDCKYNVHSLLNMSLRRSVRTGIMLT